VVEDIADVSVAPGEEIRFQVNASDPNEPSYDLKYELDFPPDGATIDEETGEFTWTPGEATAGRSIRVAVRVTQSDGPKRSSVKKFQVVVKSDAPDPDPSPEPSTPTPEVDAVRTFSGHEGIVGSVAVGGRGRVVASAAADATIRIWSVKSGKTVQTLEPAAATLSVIAFSPDALLLATGGTDDIVRIWDNRTGKLLKKLKGLEGDVRAIAFSPDGKFVAAGSSAAEKVEMWDVDSGKPQQTFEPTEKRERDFVLSLAFRPDGSRLAIGRLSGVVSILDVTNGSKDREAKTGLPAAIAFRPDNRALAIADLSRKLSFWKICSGDTPIEKALKQPPTAVAYSSDGTQVAVVIAARHAQVWDADRLRVLYSLSDIPFIVRTVHFSEDGNQVILIGTDKQDVKIRTWDSRKS